MVGLFAVTAVFLIWLRGMDELVADLPEDPGPRALGVTLSALIPCLLATYPALLAWWGARLALPSYEAPWWGALLVTYAGCWLLLYAVVEHKWRNRTQTPDPSDAGDAT